MPHPSINTLTVTDLVPFGNTGSQAGFFALRLTPPEWKAWRPGQFAMLRSTRAHSDLLWARPFSICSSTARDLIFFFQVRGRATAEMAKLTSGDTLDVWGPLGNAFAMNANMPTLLLAGGIGIVPFVGYVLNHPTPWEVTLEFGHRLPLDCYPFDSINEKAMADAHMEYSDQDRTRFVALMEKRISQFSKNGLILACGPTSFLKTVQTLSFKYQARTQLCLETRMACGVGACLGCVVKANLPPEPASPIVSADNVNPAKISDHTEGTHVQTCTCGPNFWADSVFF